MINAREKRKDPRQPLKYPARLNLGDGTPPIPCLLLDVSKSGAKIVVDGVDELPTTFTLLLAGENGRRRQCRVVWQNGKNFGLTFVKPTAEKDETMLSFRELMKRR